MAQRITSKQAKTLVGRRVIAHKKDGTVVSGKLVSVKGNQLHIEVPKGKKSVKTKALLPFLLYDIAALGAAPYGGFGYGAYGPYNALGAPGVFAPNYGGIGYGAGAVGGTGVPPGFWF